MSGGGSVKELKSKEELDNVRQSGAPVILHFWASWCDASKHIDQVFSHLSTEFPHAHFSGLKLRNNPRYRRPTRFLPCLFSPSSR